VNLDARIREASEDLQRGTSVDPVRGLAELHHTRSRRTAGFGAAAAAFVLAVTIAWASVPDDDKQEPAPPVPRVTNGVLVGLVGMAGSSFIDAVSPGELAHLPSGATGGLAFSFSADGSELLYVDTESQVTALDVVDGSVRVLAECDDPQLCFAGVSPDTSHVAFGVEGGLLVRSDQGEQTVPLPGVGPEKLTTTAPVWSPDGSRLAFSTPKGLWVVDVDGSGLRLLARSPDVRVMALPPSWSPDGRSVVYLAGTPVKDGALGGSVVDARYTVVTVDVTTGERRDLAEAGRCACLGIPPPAVAWSPDGRLVAFAGAPPHIGLFTVPSQGGEVERLSSRRFHGRLAWQPVVAD
jgi:Tol biopolymer transport system component